MIINFNREVNDFNDIIKKSDKVLVDFHAKWCGPCRMLGPVLEELSELREDVTILKIDVDKDPEIARAFNVSSIPTLFIFENGNIKDSFLGYRNVEELNFLLN